MLKNSDSEGFFYKVFVENNVIASHLRHLGLVRTYCVDKDDRKR